MIKKYILAIIAVTLAVWVGFFFGKKSVEAPNQPVNIDTNQPVSTSTISTPETPPQKKTPTNQSVPKSTSVTPTITKDGTYIISYTNSGFKPVNLTIKTGKSVRFINNSTKAMSITTTSVDNQTQSELNQGKTVGQGGVYDFTFMKAGPWGYMNRNNPNDRGTIIVQ